jgi:hypothetical protein
MELPELPPEFAMLFRIVDAQAPNVREMFQDALTMLIVEDDKAKIVEQHAVGIREHLTLRTVREVEKHRGGREAENWVSVEMPKSDLEKKEIKIHVNREGGVLGKLYIAKGGISWMPIGKKRPQPGKLVIVR